MLESFVKGFSNIKQLERNSARKVILFTSGLDTQRMDIRAHHVSERFVNYPVALNSAAAIERLGDNDYLEVSTPVLGSCMTRVQMTLVFHQ